MKAAPSSSRTQHPADRRAGHRTLHFRITVLLLALFIMILIVTVLVMGIAGRSIALKQSYRYMAEKGHTIIAHFNQHIQRAETLTRSLAKTAESLPRDIQLFHRIIPSLIYTEKNNGIIAGGGIWPEPFAFDPERERRSFFWGLNPDGEPTFFSNYNTPSGPGYHREEWYVPARYLEPGQTYWSRAYADPYTTELMVTCTAPLNQNGQFFGVATIDLKLSGLNRLLTREAKSINGYIFAVDRNNRFMAFPDPTLIKKTAQSPDPGLQLKYINTDELARKRPAFGSIAGALTAMNTHLAGMAPRRYGNEPDLVRALQSDSKAIDINDARMIAAILSDPLHLKETGHTLEFKRLHLANDIVLNQPAIVSIFFVPHTYWKLIMVMPESEATAMAGDITQKILVCLIATITIGAVIAFFCFRHWIIVPLTAMTSSLIKVAEGGEETLYNLPEARQDELGDLAYWFNRRTDALRRSNQKLQQEIDERLRAETALRESENRYRMIFNAANDALIIFDVDTLQILDANPRACRQYGYSRDEFKAISCLDISAEPDQSLISLRRQEKKVPLRYHRRKDEAVFPVEITINYYSIKEGKIAISVIRDISERHGAEKALQKSEERYRSLVENTPDGYFICDESSGEFLFLNQRIMDMLGYTQKEALALSIWDIVEPEAHSAIQDGIAFPPGDGTLPAKPLVVDTRRKDGSTFRAEITTARVEFQNNPAIQGMLRDVTRQEQLQNQLHHAQRMESIGRLAGGIAHDFNNMLMGILGNASLGIHQPDEPEVTAERFRNIEAIVRNASELTRQLLGFARSGKYQVEPTDINALVDGTVKLFSRTRKEITIYTKFGKNLGAVEADRTQIEQVLIDLYLNAWQAMPDGGKLYIETACAKLDESDVKGLELPPGSYVKISVTDTGIGMDPVTLQQIFDPFFTTRGIGRGTGLGLSAAYGTVKNHGGMIHAASQTGKGSTITIYLPATEKHPIDHSRVDNSLIQGQGTILLVDDEDMIRNIGKAMLQKLGFQVKVAEDGHAALNIFFENRDTIHLVILDMIMPDMEGGEVFDRLKQIDPNVAVILSSGYSVDGKASDIINRGCRGFIQKPFTMRELSKKLREIGLDCQEKNH